MDSQQAREKRPLDGGQEQRPASIGEMIEARLTRRQALTGLAAATLTATAGAPSLAAVLATPPTAAASTPPSTLGFAELPHGLSETHAVATGYEATTLIRWGDPLEAGAPAFDPLKQSAAAQAKQWGFNNDFVAYMPLPMGSASPDRGLLCVNFEHTLAHLMFPGLQANDPAGVTREQCEIEMAAHGHGIVEIRRDGDGRWHVVGDSPYNRRITALASQCQLAGPAAGDARLRTSADPTGTRVIGTLNNCAGGKTPWGTVLIAEENFNYYFGGDPAKTQTEAHLRRYGITGRPVFGWSRFFDRFDIEKEPNESNRFGWIVEVDPYDPNSTPIKRTALGRFKHEAATTVVDADGRVIVYSGDDERFQFVYKFVTSGKLGRGRRASNRDLLDSGTLYVAKFDEDGKLSWLPLSFGAGPLTEANGFHSQADVLIGARRAAELLGATPMDRPEDMEANPKTGLVYVVLTNNSRRSAAATDAANPRGPNPHGHILELSPPVVEGARQHASTAFTWDIFLLAGNPGRPEDGARYHPAVSADGWLSSPDNLAFDGQGRIWIATDGAQNFGIADGLWASDSQGLGRALPRHFYRTPIGAELCGPEFNSDDTAYFAAVQHPGATDGSTFEAPSTRWPDFQSEMPPRPTIQVITKKSGGLIGS
ncbi:MAG: PhoX family phosphatase [Rhodospirillales bacterium]